MKVVAINGSPNAKGNTAFALDLVCEVLNGQGIGTERIEIGKAAVHGCIGCGFCWEKRNRRCVFNDDLLNRVIDRLLEADGVLIGSPVYYAGMNGALKAFLDRAFFVASASGALFRQKVGAGVVAVRRGGEASAWEQINKYFTISEMFIPSGNYWNMVFGMEPGEAARDTEGAQNMRILGANMAWLLKAVAAQRETLPPAEEKEMMNFIR